MNLSSGVDFDGELDELRDGLIERILLHVGDTPVVAVMREDLDQGTFGSKCHMEPILHIRLNFRLFSLIPHQGESDLLRQSWDIETKFMRF